ncbi:hypothetical protein P3T36_001083 [Kitasatospora sp. MAP12-15]|uniref:DNA glycosylase AlkZ-like family protein n=1 Tax=unclassified Kitasatospora TaxID=2633591 RepID=UPI0024746E1A|nr:crosslink repair DNA glycosylase YcaQ family protein [Kitasatospora sp. MAP12-44]MDH6114731.1 hypothetical protein [Kitasatospora sp. MAP12-44]
MPQPRVLDGRALNRALLARQHLLEPADTTPEALVEYLVGLQAQAVDPPYFGLWSRLRTFRPEQLSELLEQRRVVRIGLQRGTIHLVTAEDALTLRPLLQPVLDQALRGAYGKRLTGLRDEHGRTLYDLPDAPRPDPGTPVPVRLVAPFDNLLLSHADRTRVLPQDYRTRVMTQNGIVLGTLLVDGLVAGSWQLAAERGTTRLRLRLFTALAPRTRAAAEAEAERLLDFAAAPGESREVAVTADR